MLHDQQTSQIMQLFSHGLLHLCLESTTYQKYSSMRPKALTKQERIDRGLVYELYIAPCDVNTIPEVMRSRHRPPPPSSAIRSRNTKRPSESRITWTTVTGPAVAPREGRTEGNHGSCGDFTKQSADMSKKPAPTLEALIEQTGRVLERRMRKRRSKSSTSTRSFESRLAEQTSSSAEIDIADWLMKTAITMDPVKRPRRRHKSREGPRSVAAWDTDHCRSSTRH